MGSDTIPERNTGDTIVKGFFNTLRNAFNVDQVPRNSSGVATDQGGALGTSILRFGNAYLKKIFLDTIASGMTMSEDGTSFRFDAATGKDYSFYVNSVLKGFLDTDGISQESLGKRGILAATTKTRDIARSTGTSGSFSTNSTSYVSVTGMSTTIESRGGPIMLTLIPSGGASTSYISMSTSSTTTSGFYRFDRDSTNLDEVFFSSGMTGSGATSANITLPPGVVTHIDRTPGTGSKVYSLEAKVDGTATMNVRNCRLIAYEI